MRFKTTFTLPILLLALLSSCDSDKPKGSKDEALYQKLDSVQKELALLRKELDSKADSLSKDTVKYVPELKTKEKVNSPVPFEKVKQPAKEVIDPKEVPKSKTSLEEDTIFYFYKNSKQVSAKLSPWKNDHRKLLLYDPFGKRTFEQEDVRLSYSSRTEIQEFHNNGAVAKIKIHMNPGASMYWYETIITFSINNEPQWKTDMRYPASMDDYLNNTSYWDKKTGQWKKQEVVKEQPVPQE